MARRSRHPGGHVRRLDRAQTGQVGGGWGVEGRGEGARWAGEGRGRRWEGRGEREPGVEWGGEGMGDGASWVGGREGRGDGARWVGCTALFPHSPSPLFQGADPSFPFPPVSGL